MKPTLVTGASGFIGWHVAKLLSARGHKVRALVRPSSKLRELDAGPVTGDLRDPSSLARAVAGCSLVFHVAADYRLWAPDPDDLYRSNVDGTRNLLQAARQAGVDRVIYTSTVGCIGIPKGGPGDETCPVTLEEMSGAYKRSKFLAERAALEFAADGFPVIAVNPTAPVGDHDFKPTPTGKIILDFLKGAMPAFIDTGLNLVDVNDVAEGNLLACERGRRGERYILGCENLTLAQILQRLAKITGRPAPTVKLPYFVAYAAAVASTGWARVTGKPPRAPLDAVRMAKKKMWVSSAKAIRELGFAPGPVRCRARAGSGVVRWKWIPRPLIMLLFVAAESREFAGLLRFCANIARPGLPVAWARTAELHGNRILMIANGAGARQAARAVDAAPGAHAVVSTGFCGAVDPALRIGDIFVAAAIHGVAIQPPQSSSAYVSGVLASIDHVAQTAVEKRELRAGGASAVEMEAAGACARAQAHSLPFFCVRSVTDLADETFANDFNAALRQDGHFATMQILRSALRHPVTRLPELVRLRKRCRIAARTLGEFLADCRF